MSEYSLDVMEKDFDALIIEASKTRPILIDFWAKWCQPCLKLKPLLEEAAERAGGAFLLAKIDIDANPNLAAAFRISSVPTVVVFRNGAPVDSHTGLLTPADIDALMKPHIPGPADDLLEQAKQATEKGDHSAALKLAREAFTLDETKDEARLFFAECLLHPGSGAEDFSQVETLLEPFSDSGPLAATILKLKGRLFFRQRPALTLTGKGAELLQKGITLAAKGKTEDAIVLLLEAGELDEKLARGPVKEALIQAFHLLGEGHPKLNSWRSSLMMLLT